MIVCTNLQLIISQIKGACLVQHKGPLSRFSEVTGQGQGVWGWKSPVESRGRAFDGCWYRDEAPENWGLDGGPVKSLKLNSFCYLMSSFNSSCT